MRTCLAGPEERRGGGWVRAVGLVYTKLDYFKDANCGWHSHQAPEWSECPVGEAMVGGGCQACGDEAPCDSSDCETGTTYSAAIGACVPCGGEYRQALFVAANLLTMCCGLEAAFGTTAITMLGPGLALRGPDGSMNKAVEGILAEYELVSYLVYLSIYSFLAAGAVFAFLAEAPNVLTSLGLTALVAATYRVMARRVHVVEENFPMKKIALVSGAFFDHSAPRAAVGGGATVTATVTTPSGGGGAERPKMTLAERRGYAQLHDIVE